MVSEERQRHYARRALWVAIAIGVGVFVFFVVQDDPVTGLVIGGLLAGSGYFEYRRRLRDLEMMEPDEDPFEQRERFR